MRTNDRANLMTAGIVSVLLIIVVAVVSLQFLGDNAPAMVDSIANTTAAIADADFGSNAANSVGDGISVLIPVAFVLGLVGLVTALVTFKRKSS